MLAKENQHIFIFGMTFLFLPFIVLFAFTENFIYLAIPFAFFLFYAGWQSVSLVYFFLIASLPWSAEVNLGNTLSTDFPDEPIMLLCSALFLSFVVYMKGNAMKIEWRNPLLWLIALHLGWIFFTAATSTHFIVSLKYLLAKCWYVMAFLLLPLLIFTGKKHIQLLGIIFFVSLLIVTLIILAKHSTDQFLFIHINDAVTPFFRNHVNYSAMLVCSLPIAFAMYRLIPTGTFYKKLISIAILIILAALVLSFSRGAWLALLTGSIAYILLQKRILWQAYVIGIFITVATVFWLKTNDRYLDFAHDYKTTIFHTDFREHITATYQLKDVSTAERFNRWIAAVRMVPENPLVGVGPGTFSSNYKPYTIPAFKTWVSDNKEQSTVHNYFLLLITEQGWPGLIFFVILLAAFFYYAQNIYYRLYDSFYKQVIMAVSSMMVMIITLICLSDLIETDKIGSLFFTCIALLIISARQLKTGSKTDLSKD